MKDEAQHHFIEGVSEGELFLISPTEDGDEFILTVLEPESYGEAQQAASACFSRQQMITIVARLTEALQTVAPE